MAKITPNPVCKSPTHELQYTMSILFLTYNSLYVYRIFEQSKCEHINCFIDKCQSNMRSVPVRHY